VMVLLRNIAFVRDIRREMSMQSNKKAGLMSASGPLTIVAASPQQ